MKKLVLTLAIVLTCSVLTGCATIARGPDQDISISSNPTGAHVTVNHQYHGITPIVVTLNRRKNYNVGIELEGYMPASVAIASLRDMAMAGNCLFGGLPGVAIDSMSGAAYVLKPDTIHMNLMPVRPGDSNIRPPPQITPPQKITPPPTPPVPPKGAQLKKHQDYSGIIAGACIVGGFILAVLMIESSQ